MAANNHSSEVVAMAVEIADSCARSDIECHGHHVQIGDTAWYDLQGLDDDLREVVEFGLRYMAARGDALPYRVVCHPNYPYLRRFEERD